MGPASCASGGVVKRCRRGNARGNLRHSARKIGRASSKSVAIRAASFSSDQHSKRLALHNPAQGRRAPGERNGPIELEHDARLPDPGTRIRRHHRQSRVPRASALSCRSE